MNNLYKFFLFLSCILFALGSFFIPFGWHLLKTKQWVNEEMKKLFPDKKLKVWAKWIGFIIFSAFVGPFLIAGGGLLSTYTWNALALKSQLESQKNNFIRAVAQEFATNRFYLTQPPIEGEVYYCENNEKIDIQAFPTLNTSAANAILASGLVDLSKPEDSNVFLTILNYNSAVVFANKNFDRFNDDLFAISGKDWVERRIKRAEKYQKATKNSPWGKQLFMQEKKLLELLSKKYWKILLEQSGIKPQEIEQIQEILKKISTAEPTNVQEE